MKFETQVEIDDQTILYFAANEAATHPDDYSLDSVMDIVYSGIRATCSHVLCYSDDSLIDDIYQEVIEQAENLRQLIFDAWAEYRESNLDLPETIVIGDAHDNCWWKLELWHREDNSETTVATVVIHDDNHVTIEEV